MNILTEKIEQWAKDRGLAHADSTKQICKLTEEVGEVARAINKGYLTDLEDGIGDCFVALTIFSYAERTNDSRLCEIRMV